MPYVGETKGQKKRCLLNKPSDQGLIVHKGDQREIQTRRVDLGPSGRLGRGEKRRTRGAPPNHPPKGEGFQNKMQPLERPVRVP